MLNAIMCVGDRDIPGIFIDTGKTLEQAWEEYGNQAVYMTDSSEMLRKIKQIGVASLYLEKAQRKEKGEIQADLEGNFFNNDADYIWQMEDENDWPDQNYINRIWQRHMHIPWLIAETKRLLIRESVMEDLLYFQKFYDEEKDNLDVQSLGKNAKEQLESYITRRYPLLEYGLWTIVDKTSGAVVGRAGIEELPDTMGQLAGEPELAYLIGREYRRKGYATEACEAILYYAAEELEMRKVYVRTSGSNLLSAKVAENLGLLKVESITEYKDLLYCGLLTFREGKYII